MCHFGKIVLINFVCGYRSMSLTWYTQHILDQQGDRKILSLSSSSSHFFVVTVVLRPITVFFLSPSRQSECLLSFLLNSVLTSRKNVSVSYFFFKYVYFSYVFLILHEHLVMAILYGYFIWIITSTLSIQHIFALLYLNVVYIIRNYYLCFI